MTPATCEDLPRDVTGAGAAQCKDSAGEASSGQAQGLGIGMEADVIADLGRSGPSWQAVVTFHKRI